MNADAVVIGSGPNGLAAAITLAQAGARVTVFEAADTVGGGLCSEALTLPGFVHDVCASVFAMTLASPFFRELALDVAWVKPPVGVAHPFLDGTAATITRSIAETCATLGEDADAYRRVFEPLVLRAESLFPDLFAPLRVPRHPLALARFGAEAVLSAKAFAFGHFEGMRARALFAGCAAHGFMPLDRPLSAAIGVALAIAGHALGFAYAIGGAGRVAEALVAVAAKLGVEIVTGQRIATMSELPPARAYLFDVAPLHLAEIARGRLGERYERALRSYRYGPAVFKIDWALSDPIPWRAPECRSASTVHVGGTFEEIAAAEQPFILVAQPSLFDPTRAPEGRHTGWAYAHVPFASTRDWTDVIEARIEQLGPGFRDVMSPAALERHDENLIGGHIIGGIGDLAQIFARPVRWLAPYTTPDPSIYICSASTPPGAGIHGMCGRNAARVALARRFGARGSALNADRGRRDRARAPRDRYGR